jgi:hypothetical protein
MCYTIFHILLIYHILYWGWLPWGIA